MAKITQQPGRTGGTVKGTGSKPECECQIDWRPFLKMKTWTVSVGNFVLAGLFGLPILRIWHSWVWILHNWMGMPLAGVPVLLMVHIIRLWRQEHLRNHRKEADDIHLPKEAP